MSFNSCRVCRGDIRRVRAGGEVGYIGPDKVKMTMYEAEEHALSKCAYFTSRETNTHSGHDTNHPRPRSSSSSPMTSYSAC